MSYDWQYYDLLLVGIALSLGLGAAAGVLTPVGLPAAAAVSGTAGVLLIGHGLFVNGPVDAPADLTDPVEALN